jgi:signal transduction histidine kinase
VTAAHAGSIAAEGRRPGRAGALFGEDRWIALLVMTRLLGAGVAIALLIAHRVTSFDGPLAAVTALWTLATLLAFARSVALRASALAWMVDTLAAFALVLVGGDWRSPFYIYSLTTLVLPTTTLRWQTALAWGAAFSTGYGITAALTRQVPADTLGNTIRLETLATHLFVPILVTTALAYAGALLGRLREERERSERLAIQTERQRIAWELHDSAKQRVHAAHLLISALDGHVADTQDEIVTGALAELRSATADMETSIAELRSPIDGRPIDALLRQRAAELSVAGGRLITVEGRLPALPPLVSAHAYRIAAEALTNAVRHAQARAIRVLMTSADQETVVTVEDDGVGLDHSAAPVEGHGMRSMRGRAETIGAALDISPGSDGRGTRVTLRLPAHPTTTGDLA